jgi:hypothetical protein
MATTTIANSSAATKAEIAALSDVHSVASSNSNLSYCINTTVNSIDSSVHTSLILGPGESAAPNKIGAASKPVGTENNNPGLWATDSGYVSGAATVASITSGYDSINNQIGGVINGAGHNFLQYHSGGHSNINGGSYQWISGFRSTINGGVDNRITGSSTGYGLICQGRRNGVTGGECSSVENGFDNVISSANNHVTIINGDFNTASGSAKRATVINGSYNEMLHDGAVSFGYKTKTVCSASLTWGADKLVDNGDCQNVMAHFKARTTDATLTNMYSRGDFVELDDAKTSVITGKVYIVGLREDTGAASAYELDFMVTWDGSTATVYDSSGNGATRDFNVIHNGASIVTAPHLTATSGSVRPKCTGLAGVNIKWTCKMDITMTQFTN